MCVQSSCVQGDVRPWWSSAMVLLVPVEALVVLLLVDKCT